MKISQNIYIQYIDLYIIIIYKFFSNLVNYSQQINIVTASTDRRVWNLRTKAKSKSKTIHNLRVLLCAKIYFRMFCEQK